MGSTVSIKNETELPLNVCLRQLTPLYYRNDLQPGEEATFKVGKVWFKIEAKISKPDNKYRMRQNVIPILTLSLAAASTAASITTLALSLTSGAAAATVAAAETGGNVANIATSAGATVKVATTATSAAIKAANTGVNVVKAASHVVKTVNDITNIGCSTAKATLDLSTSLTGGVTLAAVSHSFINVGKQWAADYIFSSPCLYMNRNKKFVIRGGPPTINMEKDGIIEQVVAVNTLSKPIELFEIKDVV